MNGKTSYAIGLYQNVKKHERGAERANKALTAWLKTLTGDEFNAYAAATMELDQKDNLLAELLEEGRRS